MICIIVAQRGWVYVGDVNLDNLSLCVAVRGAMCVRKWGTSKGLSELVPGPRPETLLEKQADILVMREAIILVIPVDQVAWAPVMKVGGDV